MIQAIRTFAAFLWKRDVASWRRHRLACRNMLPKEARKEVQANGE